MLDDVLYDEKFWGDVRASLSSVMLPLLYEAFRAGAQRGAVAKPRMQKDHECVDCTHLQLQKEPVDFDWDAITGAADRVILEYMDEWWAQFSRSTQDHMRAVFQLAADNDLTPKDVARLLEPLFGEDRALVIAVTEMTRLMGRGAQAQYRLAGWTKWEWTTQGDADVDANCDGKAGNVYPIEVPFDPEHPRCRCWPEPVL